jgi:hypothetical protein
MSKPRKKIGLFGTPCGGTFYTVHRLTDFGLDVGHEAMREDGLVCGFWIFGSDSTVERPNVDDYAWDVLGVVVRHPLLVAQTLPHILERRCQWPWSRRDSPILHALRYWVEAHTMVQAHVLTAVIRVDTHFEGDLDEVCRQLGINRTPPLRSPVSKRVRWPRLTWSEWMAQDPHYCRRGQALVERYGLDDV